MNEQRKPRGRRPVVGEPVLDRAFRLLTAFSAEDAQLSLTSLSARTGIPLSSVLRLCRKLGELGMLERTTGGDYVIGLKLLEVASLAPRGHGLRAVAMPFMEDLHHATNHHVLLAVRDRDEAVLVERLSAHEAGMIMYRIGGRVPLHSTSVGLVLLAYADPELKEEILNRKLTLEPEGQDVSSVELRARLASVRQQGFAVATRPLPEPATSVAAPIFGPGQQIIGAMSVLGPVGVIEPRVIIPALVAVARSISRAAASGNTGATGHEGGAD
ncbi:IclR family transcriptional regulator [Arthrobacter sp. AQ5-06]|nr:IclR family transcriptional regulator [Arthrobacter sp. AQ5-06]